MAYQNFFARIDKQGRVTPAQTSGKEITAEFRMRNDGESIQVVRCDGFINPDGTISTRVIVYGGNGKELFNQAITCPK